MNHDLSLEKKLECMRYGVVASLGEARDRMATLQAMRRKTKASHCEMEVLESISNLLEHTLEFIDELLTGRFSGEKRNAGQHAKPSKQNLRSGQAGATTRRRVVRAP